MMRLATLALPVALAVAGLGRPAAASPARDVDGDGFDDVALDDHRLYYGSANGLVAGTTPALPGNKPALFYDLAVVGDVDGDGFADVVLGDPACPAFATALPACETGSAYVYLGGPKRLGSKPSQTLTVPDKNTHFGMRIIPVGDLDGDGLFDVAIPDATGVHLYRGTRSGLATTPVDLPPAEITPAGDLDGDGTADLLAIGAGGAIIYYAGDPKHTQALALGRDVAWVGAGAGDFDGDGFGDLAIAVEPASADGSPRANAVVLYRGSAKGLVTAGKHRRFTRDHARAELGTSFASVGDLDGDHRDDLVVLASCSVFDAKASSCNAGTAYVYLGSGKGLRARPLAALSPVRSNFGITGNALAALGDMDGDGRPDFAFGAYVYRGAKGGLADKHPPSM